MFFVNTVIDVLKKYIDNQNFRFVFPSQTAAGLWAQKVCTLGIARSVASRRFLAWDRFKEEVVENNKKESSPSNNIIRRIFAQSLIRKNYEKITRGSDGYILSEIIPPQFAEGGNIFASGIAAFLPSLSSWEKSIDKAMGQHALEIDPVEHDLYFIKKEYAEFLDRYNLFEPSWEEITLGTMEEIPNDISIEISYVLFFPELIEDFFEYDSILTEPRFIKIGADRVPMSNVLQLYGSAREEILSAALEIRKLHDEGIPYEEMAVSVPELEDIAPHLLRELELNEIPFIKRAGTKLGKTGVGHFFNLVNNCASTGFSFKSLKALILNNHIPWKEREKNSELIKFGIKYNCISPYIQDGKQTDIWEEAFKQASPREISLQNYYESLKKGILKITQAKNFLEIRKKYFEFKNIFLDMENITADDNAILARCIEELSSLIEIDEFLNDTSLVPSSPLAFFLECLDEKEYVKANQKSGVNIFKWRVAAASPFSAHFVLNATQSASTVLYQPMKFLRQDKRLRLGMEDRDASAAFFCLSQNGVTRFSSSTQAYTGWAIPHSFFAQGKINEAPFTPPSPYREERLFWQDSSGAGSSALLKLYPLQKKSFNKWISSIKLKQNYFSLFNYSFIVKKKSEEIIELLVNSIPRKDEKLRVSPALDLNVFYECPVKWLYRRIFKLDEYSLDAVLLDDISLGLLYHKILQNLFEKIKTEDKIFSLNRINEYKIWAREITKNGIESEPAFKGPLAVPLVMPQAVGMAKRICALLELEAKYFDGYEVFELEFPVSMETEDLFINGVIDRVSLSPDGEAVIFDYKSSYLPGQTGIEKIRNGMYLEEFQMPLYVKLYEGDNITGINNIKVNSACFYSIKDKKIRAAMGDGRTGSKNKEPKRDEYNDVLIALDEQIENFERQVKNLNFTPWDLRMADCAKCKYKPVCRSLYFKTEKY